MITQAFLFIDREPLLLSGNGDDFLSINLAASLKVRLEITLTHWSRPPKRNFFLVLSLKIYNFAGLVPERGEILTICLPFQWSRLATATTSCPSTSPRPSRSFKTQLFAGLVLQNTPVSWSRP